MNAFSTGFPSSDSLYIASVSDSAIHKAIRRLGPSKSVGFDDIPTCII